MNRETFMNNIRITDTDILSAFEELMALYNIYNSVDTYTNIIIEKTASSLASFDISYPSENDAKKVYDICNGVSIKIYNIPYNISCTVDGCKIHINLK